MEVELFFFCLQHLYVGELKQGKEGSSASFLVFSWVVVCKNEGYLDGTDGISCRADPPRFSSLSGCWFRGV